MTDTSRPDPPSVFVDEWIARLATTAAPAATALDVASGRGRHLLALAHAEFRTYGVDWQFDVLLGARARLADRGLSALLWCADLTTSPLPVAFFDVVVVTRYLQRDLFPALADTLAPGGVLLYETFTEEQLRYDRGPRCRDYLLRPRELESACPQLDTLFYEEVDAPEAVARLAARAPRNR